MRRKKGMTLVRMVTMARNMVISRLMGIHTVLDLDFRINERELIKSSQRLKVRRKAGFGAIS